MVKKTFEYPFRLACPNHVENPYFTSTKLSIDYSMILTCYSQSKDLY